MLLIVFALLLTCADLNCCAVGGAGRKDQNDSSSEQRVGGNPKEDLGGARPPWIPWSAWT